MTKKPLTQDQIQQIDTNHIWHPYSAINSDVPVYPVKSAKGVYIELYNGQKLLDGMSSWWSTLHGYNPPAITQAIKTQAENLCHVMFGGLTHEPAAYLTKRLVELSPEGLNKVFLSDSGSVSVDIAIKMSIQYWQAKQRPNKNKILALEKGYHGDTLGAMSVCDPTTGMHHLFESSLTKHFFAKQPPCKFSEQWREQDFDNFKNTLTQHINSIAAVILEPIVQGAGGMYFYSPMFIKRVRELCDDLDVLLIADEIATGFGRTGKLFACEHANISPDILCLGKTLTGGSMTLAATLCTDHIADTICNSPPGVFMHGPTFMGNPLACAAASANIDLLLQSDWENNISRIEKKLKTELNKCVALNTVKEVRVLGAIGVVEMHQPVNMKTIQPKFVEHNIWVRPFGNLVYIMPAYIMTNEQINTLTKGIYEVLKEE